MESINRFVKGVVADFNPVDIDNQSWVFPSWNIRIVQAGDMMVVKPIKGNRELFSFQGNYNLIGAKEYANVIYLVLHDPDTNFVEVGSYPSVKDFQNGFVYEYGKLPNTKDRDHLGKKLGYTGNKVDMLFTQSYDGTVDIYLNDGLNPTYIMNNCFNEKGDYVDRQFYVSGAPNVLRQINSTSSPALFDALIELPGGRVRPGNYQLFLRYSNKSFDTTPFISQSKILSVVSRTGEDRTGKFNSKNSVQNITNKKIKAMLSNLDKAYDYFQIAYVLWTGNEGDEAISEAHLISNYYSTKDIDTVYITGSEVLETISLDDIASILSLDNICKAHAIINARYIGANWINSGIKDDTLFELSQKIKLSVRYEPINDTNQYDAAFREGEIYPFGIVYLFTDGRETDVYPIDNEKGLYLIPKNPDKSKLQYHTYVVADYRTDEFDLSINESPYPNIISGWYIVRGERIANVISEGVTVPTADGVKFSSMFNMFYNKQPGAASGYSIPITGLSEFYPTYTMNSDKDKIVMNALRFVTSLENSKKRAFFSAETLFDDLSNVQTIDGDSYYVNKKQFHYEVKRETNNNQIDYPYLIQDRISEYNNNFQETVPIESPLYFIFKGLKKGNGGFSAFIPDPNKEENPIRTMEDDAGGWFSYTRSMLFNNYIGFINSESNIVDELILGDNLVENGLLDTSRGWQFTGGLSIDTSQREIIGSGVDGTAITTDSAAITCSINEDKTYKLFIETEEYISGDLSVFAIVKNEEDESFETLLIKGNIIGDSIHEGYISLNPYSWEEEYAGFPIMHYAGTYVDHIKIVSNEFNGKIKSISVFELESASSTNTLFSSKIDKCEIKKYKTDAEYLTEVTSTYQIRSSFYQKISGFLKNGEFGSGNVDLKQGDTYSGFLTMRLHKWFGAYSLIGLNEGAGQTYQHGVAVKYFTRTSINIFARSTQRIPGNDYVGEYSFLPLERTTMLDWIVSSSLEKDMHESTKLNAGYSVNQSIKAYIGYDDLSPKKDNTYQTRLRSSDKRVSGAYYNAFKSFRANEYQDYDEQFGPIVALFNHSNNLISVQNDAINMHYLNEKSNGQFDIVTGSSTKYIYEDAYMKASFGAQSRDHTFQTKDHVYGVDVKNYKIWVIGVGSSPEGKQIVAVKDLGYEKKIEKELLSLFERITGKLNYITIGYDDYHKEVLFTFSYFPLESNDGGDEINPRALVTDVIETLVFSEKTQSFMCHYNIPANYYGSYINKMLAFKENKAWIHDDKAGQLSIFGQDYPAVLSYIVNGGSEEASPLTKKFFEGIKIRMPKVELVKIEFATGSQTAELNPFYEPIRFWLQPEYNEYHWEVPMPLSKVPGAIFDTESQLKGEWLKVTVTFQGKEEFFIVYATALFNPINY